MAHANSAFIVGLRPRVDWTPATTPKPPPRHVAVDTRHHHYAELEEPGRAGMGNDCDQQNQKTNPPPPPGDNRFQSDGRRERSKTVNPSPSWMSSS